MPFVAFVTQCSPAFNDNAQLRGLETSREWDSAPSYASPCLRPVRTFGQCGWCNASSARGASLSLLLCTSGIVRHSLMT